jgi:WD40 repeat protein/DNA-binding SARP family transcriptional activator
MSRLAVSLFGPFEATLDGALVTTFKSNKVRALLAYLAAEADRPHRREALAGLLWPDWLQQSAMSSLRSVLVDLRKNIGDRDAQPPFLLITRESIQLNREASVRVDVGEFEQTIGEKGGGGNEKKIATGEQRLENNDLHSDASGSLIRNLQFAISLYRGPFMAGFSLPDSPAFEQWVLARREGLHRQALQALYALAEVHEQQGECEAGLPYARRQVAVEPWHEPGQQQLMRLLALSGQRSAALAQYEACRQALADELQVEPSAETKRLVEAIRDENMQGIREQGIGEKPLTPSPYPLPPAPGEAPFKGLQYFDVADAGLFFGREALTARLVGHIRQMVDVGVGAGLAPVPNPSDGEKTDLPLQDGCCFLAVVGASGSGKSSVVRAGVVPALMSGKPLADGTLPPEGSWGWHIHVFTPTAHPLETLAISLTREAESLTAVTRMMDDFAQDPRSLQVYAQRLYTPTNPGLTGKCRLLLVVDQFEELFTLCRSEAERTAFLDNLLTAAQAGGPTQVIVVLRADFYGHCAQYPLLRQALCSRQEYIGPMEARELRCAIEAPTQHNGWRFEPGLVDLILRDTGEEPGALPLLEHALLETWLRRSGSKLTHQGYVDAGGVHGAIAKTAESVFTRLTPEQQGLARRIFLRLTGLGEGTQDTRRRAPLSELAPTGEDTLQVNNLLKQLADARLITLSEDTAEVAHEALIREWPVLRQWLSEDRDGLRLHRHLTDSAEAWAEVERDAGELYRGARLAQAQEWAQSHPDEMNALEEEFLQASQAQAQAEAVEREAQRQRELDAALRIAETARRLAETERQRAEQQAQAAAEQTANAKRLRRRAWALAGVLGLALLLVVATIFLAQVANRNAEQARSSAQQANTEANTRATAEADALISLEKSEAQRLAAEANRLLFEGKNSGVAVLLALRSLSMLYTPQGDEALSRASRLVYPMRIYETKAAIRGIAFNGDGTQLVTNSADNRVRLWDVASGQIIRTFHGETDIATAVDISADGRYVAALGGNVVVWDGYTGQEIFKLDNQLVITNIHGISITVAQGITISGGFNADISSDGNYLLVGHGDGSARIWEIATGKEIRRFPGHVGGPLSYVFSPDDRYVLTSDFGPDQGIVYVRLWDARTGELLRVYAGHRDYVEGLAISPDDKTILTTSADQSACFWDVESGHLIRCIQAGTPFAFNAVFSPDGRYALAGGIDGVAHLWDVSTGQEIHRYAQSQILGGVAFSPDGKMVATASFDGSACIWDTEAKLIQDEFSVTGVAINGLFFSPDGGSVAAGVNDGTVRIWDVNSGTQTAVFTGLGAPVWGVNYAADGTVLFVVTAGKSMFTLDVRKEITRSQFSLLKSSMNGADIAPDGKTAVAMDTLKDAYVFDAVNGVFLKQFPGNGYCQTVAFSPDGSRVAIGRSRVGVGDHGQTWIFSYPGLEKLLALDYPTDSCMTAIVFSADGRLLLSAGALGNNDLILWDTTTGEKLKRFTGFTGILNSVSLSHDGRYAAAAGIDNIARMWEVATGREVRRFIGHTGAVVGIDFSPDGKWVATSSSDGTLKLWLTDLEALKAAVCNALPRDLTADERAVYGITDPGPTCPQFEQP